jgi:hypothetical protein
MDVHHIHAAFAFLKLPRKEEEWRNGVECLALASVKAFSSLHRIRYAGRPAGMKDTVCCDEPTADHEQGSHDMAASNSGDSEDETVYDSTLRRPPS